MKKNTFLLLLVLLALPALAQAQQFVNYQGIMRNEEGAPAAGLRDGAVTIRISGGAGPEFSEVHTGVETNAFGIFTLQIGSRKPNEFRAIDWASGGKTLNVQASFPGGGTLSGNTPLLAVPYALYAEKAGNQVKLQAEGTGLTIAFDAATNTYTLRSTGNGSGKTYKPGQGINITAADEIVNTGDLNAADDILTTTPAGGDITGTFGNLQIQPNTITPAELAPNAVTGEKIANGAVTNGKIQSVAPDKLEGTGATAGQVLKWDGTRWKPDTDATGGPGGGGTPSGPAGGDLSGTYPDPIIAPNVVTSPKIANGAVTNEKITSVAPGKLEGSGAAPGQVLKWNGTAWAPGADATGGPGTPSYTPGTGIDLTGNIITNTGDVDPTNDVLTTTPAGGDVTGTFDNLQIQPNTITPAELAPNAVTGEKIANGAVTADKIGQNGANTGQILKWNGTAWTAADDNSGGTGTPQPYTPGTGIAIANNVITNTEPDQEVKLTGAGGVTITGTYPEFTITGGSGPGTPYTAGEGLELTGTQFKARVNEALWNANQLQGRPLTIPAGEIAVNSVLKWNGTAWAPGADATGGPGTPSYTPGTGIDLTGNVITNTGDLNATDDILTTTSAGGDVTGTFDNLQIQPNTITPAELANGAVGLTKLAAPADPAADNGKVLKWDGTQWTMGTDLQDGGGTPGGTPSGPAGGDLTGTYPDPVIAPNAVTSPKIANGAVTNEKITSVAPDKLEGTGAAPGQVLKWNGIAWAPGPDNAGDAPAVGTTNSIQLTSGNLQLVGDEPTPAANRYYGTDAVGQRGFWPLPGGEVNITPGDEESGINVARLGNTFRISSKWSNPIWNANKLQGNDVADTAPQNDQVLKWNATASRWEPGPASAGPSGGVTATGGQQHFVPKFNDANSLIKSSIFDNGTQLGIGLPGETPNPQAGVHIEGRSLLISGTIGDTPGSGAGTRLMWIPSKGAFRAGRVRGTEWDAGNIGEASIAVGENVQSSGWGSIALGRDAVATDQGSVAIGNSPKSYFRGALAIGWDNVAIGNGNVAIGDHAFAIGPYSTAIGGYVTTLNNENRNRSMESRNFSKADLNKGYSGCFVIADAQGGDGGDLHVGEPSDPRRYLFAETDNQFIARFKNGYKFYVRSDRSKHIQFTEAGVQGNISMFLPVVNISDVRKKENFRPVDGEEILNKIGRFKLSTWNYRGHNSRLERHYGPMAQDFFAAFGKDAVGKIGTDTTIASIDIAGLNFTAIQALVKRTEELRQKDQQLEQKARELEALLEKLEAQRAENERLRAEVSAQQVKSERMENDLEAVKRHLGLDLKAAGKD